MNELLIPISDDEFLNRVNIRFSNILDGFNEFKSFTILATDIKNGENKIIRFIEKIFELNNFECYVDFYISKISNEDKEKLIDLVPEEDKKVLISHLNSKSNNGTFYKLNNVSLIPFLVRLNTREIFFVTFYFTNKPITIWGNYNMKFPCFLNKQENLNFYYNLSESFGLQNI